MMSHTRPLTHTGLLRTICGVKIINYFNSLGKQIKISMGFVMLLIEPFHEKTSFYFVLLLLFVTFAVNLIITYDRESKGRA